MIPFPNPNGAPDPRQNRLLAALPEEDYAHLLPHLERIPMALGECLYEPGTRMRHVYFPTTAIVSLLYVMENGATAETAVVGNDGLVGIALFMGGDTTSGQATVQGGGFGYRVKAPVIREHFGQSAPVQGILLRYTQALLTQIAQTAMCNAHHSLDEQLCRWLLLRLDLLSGDTLKVTQELIAGMLGVRRECVTQAAGNLQRAGLIGYSRGQITVLDRPGLERRSCECYGVVMREYDRLLGQPPVH